MNQKQKQYYDDKLKQLESYGLPNMVDILKKKLDTFDAQ